MVVKVTAQVILRGEQLSAELTRSVPGSVVLGMFPETFHGEESCGIKIESPKVARKFGCTLTFVALGAFVNPLLKCVLGFHVRFN